jgi:hypothetical protein
VPDVKKQGSCESTILSSDGGDDSSTSCDSDISPKKPLTISRDQHEAWKKKKRLVYENCRSTSSIEADTRRNHRKNPKSQIPKQKMTTKSQEDRPLWAVAKVTNFNTKFNEACMLEIVQVLDEPPCIVSKKTIGVLLVTKFSLANF